jgi:hypothetical protein
MTVTGTAGLLGEERREVVGVGRVEKPARPPTGTM